MNTVIDWTKKTFSNDRVLLRKEVITSFLDEEPGNGRGEQSSKYKYIVAHIDGHEIYLQRPAQFNNGFDFTLHVSGINFNPGGRSTSRPKHQDIYDDLRLKKQENFQLYQQLMNEIRLLFDCQPLTIVSQALNFNRGLPSLILLECIKWLFIEQDVTYWNYSGRGMLFNEISKI